MNVIKKKGVAFTKYLILLLVISIYRPVNAEISEQYPVWVNGIQISDSNKNDVLGDLDGEKATVKFTPTTDDKSAKLTLNGATIYEGLMINEISGVYWSAIYSNIDLTIDIQNDNILGRNVGENFTNQAERENLGYSINYGVFAEGKNLNFIGNGTLTIVDRSDGIKADNITFDKNFGKLIIDDLSIEPKPPLCGIYSTGDVTINGGDITIVSANGNGITSNKTIINGGNIKINANKAIIYTNEGLIINDNMEVTNAQYIKELTNELMINDLEFDEGFVTIKKAEFLVNFNSNGGSEITSQTIEKNSKVIKPTNPTKENFVFDGWYVDEKLNKSFDFDTPITDNITLYAKWRQEKSYSYEFIEGNNQKLTIDNIKSYILKIDGNYLLFESIKIRNLNLIKDEDYTISEGSTIITFTKNGIAKLNKLSQGEYEILIKYSNNKAVKGKIIMNQSITDNPKTADNFSLYLITCIISISVIGTGLYILNKKSITNYWENR